MTICEAKVQARALSIDNKCTQHVNRRLDMTYYTSDWYSADSTVITYYNGEMQWHSNDAITQGHQNMHGWKEDNNDGVLHLSSRSAWVEANLNE